MSAPAAWYPQPDGQQRYWDGELWTEHFAPGVHAEANALALGYGDGSAWTAQLRQPGVAAATSAGSSSAPKEGAFSKLKKAAADKYAEKRSAREELDRTQAEDAQAAGNLVTCGVSDLRK